MMHDRSFKRTTLTLIWIWLAAFALLPNILVFITSLLQQGDHELVRLQLTLSNYTNMFDTIYLKVFLRSFYLAGLCTLTCLIMGYPFAYILAHTQKSYRGILLLLVIIPFWTSSLIRSYAIVTILKAQGLLNTVLIGLGIIHQPLHLLYTQIAVVIGLVYSLLPFMILPLYANMEKLDDRLIDAAHDLGANKFQIFIKVIFPLTLPGIIAGSILVFLPAISMFYIPDLLGGAKSMLVGNLIERQFLEAHNWPVGSSASIILTLLVGIMMLIYWRASPQNKNKKATL